MDGNSSNNENNNNTCQLLWPQSNICSNNGDCLKNNLTDNDTSKLSYSTPLQYNCYCNGGYLSKGDFAIEFYDCDIHIRTVRILYSIGIVAGILNGFICLRYIILKFIITKKKLSEDENIQRQQQYIRLTSLNNKSSNELGDDDRILKKCLSSLKGFFLPLKMFITTMIFSENIALLPIFSLCFSTSFIILCSLKVYDPIYYSVGYNPVSTFFLGGTYATFWISVSIFLYSFADIVIKQSCMKGSEFKKKVEERFSFFKKSLAGIVAFTVFYAFCPLLILVVPNSMNIFGSIHYVGAAVNIMVAGFILVPMVVVPIRNDIRNVLIEQGYKPGEVEKTITKDSSPRNAGLNVHTAISMDRAQAKLSFTILTIKNNGFQQFIINCIFGFWPFFLRKASYQLPATWTIGTLVLLVLTYSVSNFGSKKNIETQVSTLKTGGDEKEKEKKTTEANLPLTTSNNHQSTNEPISNQEI